MRLFPERCTAMLNSYIVLTCQNLYLLIPLYTPPPRARGGYVVRTPEKMPVKIRLRRTGRKKKAHYRVVVADSASPRDGRFIETLGYYKPLSHPARLVLDLERVDHWLGEGAQPSATMKSLIAKARRGGDAKVALGEVDPQERKASRAEKLAARRAAEQKAEQEVAATQKAAADAAAAEAAAAEADEASEEPAAEEEAAAEAEAEEEPAAEEKTAPEAEAEEEPVAEEESAPEAEAEEEPTAEAESAEEATGEAAGDEPAAEKESEPAAEAAADANAEEADDEEKSE